MVETTNKIYCSSKQRDAYSRGCRRGSRVCGRGHVRLEAWGTCLIKSDIWKLPEKFLIRFILDY